jgi:hypothetical protein
MELHDAHSRGAVARGVSMARLSGNEPARLISSLDEPMRDMPCTDQLTNHLLTQINLPEFAG